MRQRKKTGKEENKKKKEEEVNKGRKEVKI